MKFRKSVFLLISLLVLGLAFAGAQAAPQRKFGVAIGWDVNDFGVAFRDSVLAELKENFPGCEILLATAQYDPMEQANQIERFVQAKVDAIFVSPADPIALVPALEKVAKAGIPIFCGDSMPVGVPITCTAMSSNFAMGYSQGKYICDRLNGEGNVVAINLPENSAWYDRTLGLYHALSQYPGVNLVTEHEYIAGAVGALTPKQVFKNILVKFPKAGQIDAVWCSWDGASTEVADALKEAKRDDIFVTGIDGFEQALDYVREETAVASIMGQSPREMARVLVKYAGEYFENRNIPSMVITPVYRFTRDSVPPADLGPFGYDDPQFISGHPEIMQRVL
jgi:ribose transport system substrate-binding protein